MNHRVMAILRREYLQRVRNKWFLFATLIVPLLMLGATFLPAIIAERGESRPMTIAVIDDTGDGLVERLSTVLAEDSVVVKPFRDGGQIETMQELRDFLSEDLPSARETAEAFLLFPPDAATFGSPSMITVTDLGFRERSIRVATRDAVRWLRARQAGLDPGAADALLADVDFTIEPVDPEAARSEVFQFVGFAFAMILYLMFLVYGQMVARGVLEEKTSDIVEILVSSVRPWEMMLGKIVGIGAVGLTQVGIWAVVAYTLSQFGLMGRVGDMIGATADLATMAFPWSILVFAFLFFVLGYLMYSAVFAGAGALLTSEQDIQQVLVPVMMPIVFPILIVTQVITTPNRTWIVATSMFPLFSPILMPVRNAVTNVPMWQNAGSIVLLALAIWLAAWIAGKIYRVGILMKGKRPSIPELVRWMRHG
ncbi:MAG: ABC transporter permease [Gemmatimonadales bacterium]|jgi:ABC-2 type transport system permease protein